MSSNSFKTIHVQSVLAIFFMLFAFSGPATANGSADVCARATPVALDSSLRVHPGEAGETRYFEVQVPERGWVSVDVSFPGDSGAAARIGYAGSCDAPDPSRPLRIEQSARRLTFVAPEPGSHLFRVAAQDPRQAPGRLKVSTGFVAVADLRGDADKEEDDGVFEIDPENNFVCESILLDDHGDTPSCATSFRGRRGEMAGVIGNAWGDDEDYFMLRVTRWQTLRLTTAGPTDTYGSLYDRRGHRLAVDDDGGDGSNFRIVKMLSPGLYFVKVEGSGFAEGRYRLRIEPVPW